MKVHIQLFAIARQWAGAESIEVTAPAGATIADVRAALLKQLPQLAQFGSQLRFAVNADYADDSTIVPDSADVACIPPVSGG